MVKVVFGGPKVDAALLKLEFRSKAITDLKVRHARADLQDPAAELVTGMKGPARGQRIVAGHGQGVSKAHARVSHRDPHAPRFEALAPMPAPRRPTRPGEDR